MNSDLARAQMVNQQVRAWEVLDPRVLAVMADVPRENFAPPALRGVAFADTRIPIGQGQEMLAPKTVGRLLQALRLQPGETVLEVGTGTGYVTACLALLGGSVHSLEIFAELTAAAEANLAPMGNSQITLETIDAMTLEGRDTYDAIALTGSLPEYDTRFERALKPGGRLFAIVGVAPLMEARLVTRVADDEWVTESLFETVVPPLLNVPTRTEFVF